MKYNILGYDQRTLMEKYKEYNIKGDELITLRVISDLIGIPEFENTIIDGKIYTWLKLSRIIQEIPFILTSRSTAKRRIKKLIDAGLIDRKIINSKELPSGKILKGKFGYYAKTQLNYDIQYSKNNHRSQVNREPQATNDPSKSYSTKELNKSSTKHLHVSEETRDYIYFKHLKDSHILKQVNDVLNTGRSKITKVNLWDTTTRIECSISEFGIDEFNKFINQYKKDKIEGRSVENFIGHLERYQKEI